MHRIFGRRRRQHDEQSSQPTDAPSTVSSQYHFPPENTSVAPTGSSHSIIGFPHTQVQSVGSDLDIDGVNEAMIDGEGSPQRSSPSYVPTPAEEHGLTQSTGNPRGSPVSRHSPNQRQVDDDHEMMGMIKSFPYYYIANNAEVNGLSSISPADNHASTDEHGQFHQQQTACEARSLWLKR